MKKCTGFLYRLFSGKRRATIIQNNAFVTKFRQSPLGLMDRERNTLKIEKERKAGFRIQERQLILN